MQALLTLLALGLSYMWKSMKAQVPLRRMVLFLVGAGGLMTAWTVFS